ncbi:MAG TPA: hypothetical protein VGL03_02965, partial [Thermoanaerobaculia bacterium]
PPSTARFSGALAGSMQDQRLAWDNLRRNPAGNSLGRNFSVASSVVNLLGLRYTPFGVDLF